MCIKHFLPIVVSLKQSQSDEKKYKCHNILHWDFVGVISSWHVFSEYMVQRVLLTFKQVVFKRYMLYHVVLVTPI